MKPGKNRTHLAHAHIGIWEIGATGVIRSGERVVRGKTLEGREIHNGRSIFCLLILIIGPCFSGALSN